MIRRRRLRATANMRALVSETSVSVSDLIYPLFVIEGENIKNPIDSMPGIYQYSIDRLDEELDKIREAGIKGVLLFGIPAHKDECGSEAYNEHGIIQEAIRHIKKVFPELVVIADICLCEYTSHGHCGLIKDGEILNDETLPLLAKTAGSANVDFYSGFVYSMLGLPLELYTPMFAIARIVGWSAHRMEELINTDKIIRPAYKNVLEEQPYVSLEER